MSGAAMVLMIIVLAIVFGGSALALVAAWRLERRRRACRPDGVDGEAT